MQWLNVLAWVGAAISFWGTAQYIISVGRGETQPRLASWIAWGTANGVLAVVALMHGMHTAALFNAIAAMGNVGVLVMSGVKRAGTRPHGATDWTCLTVSGLCLGAIICFPRLDTVDAVLAMCANVVATWPTLRHAWQRPQEEAWQLFAANAGANALGLVSVFAAAGAGLSNIAGPLISMSGNLALVAITVGRSWLTKTVEDVEVAIEEALEEAEQEAENVRDILAGDPLWQPPVQQVAVVRAMPPAVPVISEQSQARQRKPRLIRSY